MNYDEYGETVEPYDPDSLEDEEEYEAPPRRPHLTANLSWQQIAFIVTLNAIISLIISLAVVIIAGSNQSLQSETGIPAGVSAAQTESGAGTSPGGGTPSDMATGAGAGTIPTAQPVPAEGQPPATPLEPASYTVQPGDTLTSIADRFDVSLEDLMRANDLSDPDYVQVGQQLIVPIGGLPPVTPTFSPVPIPTDTPLPFNPPTPLPSGAAPPAEPAATLGPTSTPVPTLPSASGSEVHLALNVLNVGDVANEVVQLVNQGAFVRLSGWTLSDEDGNTYTFPDFSLWGGGAINVHSAAGSNTTTDLYWGQAGAVWEPGELATLRDADGNVIVTYMVPVL
jgi:LysM repeat protein